MSEEDAVEGGAGHVHELIQATNKMRIAETKRALEAVKAQSPANHLEAIRLAHEQVALETRLWGLQLLSDG